MPTTDTLLIFRMAGIACAVPAESVGSIVMPPSHLTQPPGSGKSTPGIFHHADYTYSVIDLHVRFGIETPRKGTGRLLLQDEGIRHFAFLVDEVVGLVRSEEGQWAGLPPYLPRSIFWSGFLYRKEIVLCTELSALRTMRDAAPLRHHLEALQQQSQQPPVHEQARQKPAAAEQPAENEREKTSRPKPAGNTPPRSDDKPAATTSPRSPSVQRKTGPKPMVTTPSGKAGQSPAARAHSGEKPVPGPVSETRSFRSAIERNKPSVQPTESPVPPSPRPAIAETTPVAPVPLKQAEPESSAMPLLPLALLLLLTLSAAWWFWPQPDSKPSRPVHLAANALPPPARQVAPAPAAEPEPEAQPQPTPTVPESTADAPPAPALPLTIERDEAGTINLIIDREAIAGAAKKPVPLSPQPAPASPAAEANNATELPVAPEPASADTVAQTDTTDATIQETPLQPDPDWPEPASPTGLEPCDCTHTVVRGDTLWDIAEQYTGNAFNYHDLARRSGIRNPDRIYPGDTVRIIIR